MITYDEMVHIGIYPYISNTETYLNYGISFWTMSPSGFAGNLSYIWFMLHSEAQLNHASPLYFGGQTIVPVINLKANTTVTGTSDDHWVVQ